MKQRGCIKEYTKGTEARLTKALKGFIRSIEGGRAMFVTLTTTETDPVVAKSLLKRWTGRVSHRHAVSGIWVLEFCNSGLVHYHVLLALSGSLARKTSAEVASVLWKAWEPLGRHDRLAFDAVPANIRKPAGLIDYMTKRDVAPGVPHPERIQKRCPVAFKGRGMLVRYWGVIGRSVTPEKPLNPVCHPTAVESFSMVEDLEPAA